MQPYAFKINNHPFGGKDDKEHQRTRSLSKQKNSLIIRNLYLS